MRCSPTWPDGADAGRNAVDEPEALPAEELARRAAGHFDRVLVEPDPASALARARESTRGGILVTGSLYLLADLAGLSSS